MSSTLTAAQRERMEQNRLRALELRRQRMAGVPQSVSPLAAHPAHSARAPAPFLYDVERFLSAGPQHPPQRQPLRAHTPPQRAPAASAANVPPGGSAARLQAALAPRDENAPPARRAAEDCAICCDAMDEGSFAQLDGCTHRFHFTCMQKWVERANCCPLCKATVRQIEKVHNGKRKAVLACADRSLAVRRTRGTDAPPGAAWRAARAASTSQRSHLLTRVSSAPRAHPQDQRGDDAPGGSGPAGAAWADFVEDEEGAAEDDGDIVCEVCASSGNEAVLLLCDACNTGCHTYCLQPALAEVPPGEWLCDACSGRWRQPAHQPAQPARRARRVIPLDPDVDEDTPERGSTRGGRRHSGPRAEAEAEAEDELIDLTGDAPPHRQAAMGAAAPALDGWRRRASSAGGRHAPAPRGAHRAPAAPRRRQGQQVVDLSGSGAEDDEPSADARRARQDGRRQPSRPASAAAAHRASVGAGAADDVRRQRHAQGAAVRRHARPIAINDEPDNSDFKPSLSDDSDFQHDGLPWGLRR